MNKAICCHERIAYKPNKIISTSTAEDGCTVLTIECKEEGNVAKTVVRQTSNCPKPSSEDQVEELRQLMVNHIAKTDNQICSTGETPVSMTTETTTTPTTTTTPETTSPAGIMIAGGYPTVSSVELFLPETGKTCSLEPLPEGREYFTLDSIDNAGTVIACGGSTTKTSCIQFSPTSTGGNWAPHSTTMEDRWLHTSWVSPAGLLLIGGGGSPSTSEFVSGGMNITLPDTSYACGIDDSSSSSIILTGGYPHKRRVTRFNLQGKVEDLPDLQVSRYAHGCGAYKSGESKIMVVAGGYDGYRISSTETFKMGSSSWTFGEALPWAIDRLSSLSLESEILLFGGYSTRKHEEIMSYNGTWSQVGAMQLARDWVASTKIYNLGQLDISGCR